MEEAPSKSSGRQTGDAAVLAAPGELHGVLLEGDGTNAVTLIVYDNASAASGTILCKVLLDAGLTQEIFVPMRGIEAVNGLYCDVTGTGAAYIVYYKQSHR